MVTGLRSIVLIGAGNVAWHLGSALKTKGFNIKQVISKTFKSASELALKLSSSFETNPDHMDRDADLYILAISDHEIEDFIKSVDLSEQFIVHTSGSTPISVFQSGCINYGVIYPLQTFSKDKPVSFAEIPLFIEANTEENSKKLIGVAETLSRYVYYADSKKRAMLHLSAVFSCNFTNHMFTLAEEILKKNNLEFNILKPLISETIAKLDYLSPSKSQTGPAFRKDINILEKHQKILDDLPELQNIYKLLSDSILKRSK